MKRKKEKHNLLYVLCLIVMVANLTGCKGKAETTDAFAYLGVYEREEAPYEDAGKLKDVWKGLDDLEEAVYLDCKRGEINLTKEFKQSTSSSSYLYVGDIKKGRPDGTGAILIGSDLSTESKSMVDLSGPSFYQILYIGEFDNGRIDGYGCLFSEDEFPCMIYDGMFKKGVYNGEGRLYAESPFSYLSAEDVELLEQGFGKAEKTIEQGAEGISMSPVPVTVGGIKYEGQFKSGKYEGEGNLYNGRNLSYSGEWKKGDKNGKGTEYFSDGQEEGTLKIKYEGEFKSGEYQGKGTLYYEDGSVNYKGKFRKGKIE